MNYDNYYKNGGMTKEESVSAIALRIGAKKEAVAKFVEKHKIDTNKLNSDLKSGEVYFMDVITAIVGKPDNKYEKQIVKKYSIKMAMGGKTQGYDAREDERLGMEYGKMSGKDFDGSHAMREHSRRDDARFEERMAKGGELTYDDFMVGDFYWNSSEGGKFKFVGKDESGRLRFEDSKGINRIFSPKRMYKYADGGMMARGGKIDEKEKLSNISYQLINTTDSFKKNNPEAYSRMKDEYKAQFIKVYGKDEYAKRHMMADGGMMAKGGEFRANNSSLLRYANFEDDSHINLVRLNPIKTSGLPYKNINKFAVSVASIEDGQKVMQFKTLDRAESKFEELVDDTKRKVGLRNEGKTSNYSDSYADGGMMADGGDRYIVEIRVHDEDGDYTEEDYEFDNRKEAFEFARKKGNVHEIYYYPKGTYSNPQSLYAKGGMADGGMMADGGEVKDLDYNDIFDVLKDKIDETATNEISSPFENVNNYEGEEVESNSRDGFIAFTDGGYEVRWFEYLSSFYSSGSSLPTKALDDEKERQINYNLTSAKESFIEEYPEIVEELGEENIDYNSLYEAGYENEAEQLSESETADMDTIMCEIGAYYYTPENSRGIDDKHTVRLFGLINLESPYHRSGNLEDRFDVDITFNSISELEKKVDKGLKDIIDWYGGSKFNESTEELKIVRMADGGLMSDERDKNGMLYALQEHVSSGEIASKTNTSKYVDIDQIRSKAIQYYVENGDKPYSYAELESVLKKFDHTKYADGGMIYEVGIDNGKDGTRTLADFEKEKDAEKFMYDYNLTNPNAKLFIDTVTSDSGYMAKGGYMKMRGNYFSYHGRMLNDVLQYMLSDDFPSVDYQIDYQDSNGQRLYADKKDLIKIENYLINNFGVTEIEQGQNTGHPLGGYTHYLYLKNVLINRYKDKMADDGMMADGGKVSYREAGENYEYVNTFGIEQRDFEKIVDAYHKSPSSDQIDRTDSRMTFNEMRTKYGREKVDEVGNYIHKTHQSHGKMADGGMMGKGGEIADIEKIKKSLISKAKAKGIYENFGQKEVRQLEDKYGSTASVQNFDNWVANFDLSQMADGGMMAKGGATSEQNEMNKKVLALVQKAKIDSKLEFGQLVVSALTDANAHSQVRKFISIIEKKPEWAEKPKEIDRNLPREEFEKQRAKTVYGSKYYDANEKIDDLGVEIANMSGWGFEVILDSLIFASEMSGRKDIAQVLEKLNTDDDIDYSKQTTDDFTLGEIVWDVDNERYGTVIGIYDDDGFASSKFELRLDSDGVQPTENLRKVGDKGDKGTKEQLNEAITEYARLVKEYGKYNDYPKQIKPEDSKDDDKPKNKWEYTDKDEIEYVVVKDKSGKELKFDGKDVISGVHDLLEKGGKLTEIGKYYSKNDVVSVFVSGKNILDKNTVSGVWIKKDAKPNKDEFNEGIVNDLYDKINGKKIRTQNQRSIKEAIESANENSKYYKGYSEVYQGANFVGSSKNGIFKYSSKYKGIKYDEGGMMADGGDVDEIKMGRTTIRKGHYGWGANTMVDNYKGFDWDISTMKNYNGDLVTNAQGGKNNKHHGYTSFEYTVFQDPSIRLKTTRPARVNEKAVSEQHAEALKIFKEKVGNTPDKEKMADGGAIGFDALAKKVAKNYEGDEVKKEFQDEYGKKYDKKEAEEVGKKVAGKVYRQQQAKGKMAKGGKVDKKNGTPLNRSQSKMTLISRKASEIRKANEPWKDAFNRAKAMLYS